MEEFNLENTKCTIQDCPKSRYERTAAKLRGKNFKTGKIVDLNFIKEFSKTKGGECLSNEYINNRTKMRWKCSCGYEWEARWYSIYNQGTWCPKDAGKRKTIEDCVEEAKRWNGICLSEKYINSTTPLQYKCDNGHIFNLTPEQVKSGTWCPECNASVGERITRGLFERIFSCEFKKVRPDTLRNEEGHKLELDGYNEDLKLAFEYQGYQHYRYIQHFHKDETTFIKRQRDDEKKVEWCEKNKITLIVIPEYRDYSDLPGIIKIVEALILQAGIILPEYEKPKTHGEILISDFNELKKICSDKGGKVLSDVFLGWDSKYEFECKCGNKWKTTAEAIKQGSWCKICKTKEVSQKQRKYTVEDAKRIAAEKNGVLLSKVESFATTDKLTWFCNIHKITWEAPFCRIRGTGWCPQCGDEKSRRNRKKHTIKELQDLAATKDGKCLSSVYTRADDKYEWECGKGHRWFATFNDIKGSPTHKPTWCPYCNKKAKHTIEEMQEWAAKKGGKCLSTEYVNAKTKLLWKCSCGNEFWAMPTNVQKGKWCPNERGKKAWETRRKNMI